MIPLSPLPSNNKFPAKITCQFLIGLLVPSALVECAQLCNAAVRLSCEEKIVLFAFWEHFQRKKHLIAIVWYAFDYLVQGLRAARHNIGKFSLLVLNGMSRVKIYQPLKLFIFLLYFNKT